jgi:hypothetical protein
VVPAAQDEVDLSSYRQAAQLIIERRHGDAGVSLPHKASVISFEEARRRERPRRLRIGR